MKVIVTKKFIDKTNGKLRTVGEVFICSKVRFEQIRAAGNYVERYENKNEGAS